MRLLILLVLLLMLTAPACRPEKEAADPAPAAPSADLILTTEGIRLWSEPGAEGAVLAELPRGAALRDLGAVSSFTTPIRLRGADYDEPWLRVATADGSAGWLYGGVLHFGVADTAAARQLLMTKRLQSFFGPLQVERIQQYRKAFHRTATLEDFSHTFFAGQALRDTLTDILASRTEVQPLPSPPNLFWLEEALPGFLPQLVDAGAAYYLFTDYRDFLALAERTTATTDDEFIELCIAAFPEDSIEYFYPAWTFPVAGQAVHSLLGRGDHRRALAGIDRLWRQSDRFHPALERLKGGLLNDITRPDVTFWEKRSKAIEELDSIITGEYACLTPQEKIALETRRRQLADTLQTTITFDHQSGIYE